ncbi:MAG: TetR/AcrR family transcriptional regulator [Planctomycetota bacterium]
MAREKLTTTVRREQIAAVALELIAARGLSNLSVGAVAEQVGLVPSALYRHFRGKEEILDAVLDLIQAKLTRNVQAVRESSDDPLTQLHSLLMAHVQTIRQNRGIPQVVFSQGLYAGQPDRRGRVYAAIREYLGEVAEIIRDGQRGGRFRAGLQPDATAVLFLGLVQPSAVLWQMSRGEFDVKRQAIEAWPLFRRAILNEANEGDESSCERE